MANLVHDDQPFPVERLIDYAVVSFSALKETSKITRQRLGRDFFKMFRQPANSIRDAAGGWRVKLC